MMIVAWTYLMHSYYRRKNIEYRYFKVSAGGRKTFDKTTHGAHKYWELERCLNSQDCPIDKNTATNLRFLIKLRHEIEHQMTTRIDDLLSARFQACCLNYNEYIKKLFGDEYGIDRYLSFSLQLASLNKEHVDMLAEQEGLPAHIHQFIEGFDGELGDDVFNNPQFAYRVLFVAKTANNRGQADQVIEFIKGDSDIASKINQQYAVIKETERKKILPRQVVEQLQEEGYPRFTMHNHTELWKLLDAKNPKLQYGVQIVKTWYWYERWLDVVRNQCKEHAAKYR